MRTKNNGELRISNVGEVVTLVGWCSKKRDLGGLVFIDLRDRWGITQIVVNPSNEYYNVAVDVAAALYVTFIFPLTLYHVFAVKLVTALVVHVLGVVPVPQDDTVDALAVAALVVFI